jgi:hypothetical protein
MIQLCPVAFGIPLREIPEERITKQITKQTQDKCIRQLTAVASSSVHLVVRICSQIPVIKTTGSKASRLVELSLHPMKRIIVVALLTTSRVLSFFAAIRTESAIEIEFSS